MAQTDNQFAEYLFQIYPEFKEASLSQKRIKHGDIIPLIEKIQNKKLNVKLIGKSYEEREIFQIKAGSGDVKILLWSQMHGNESTATQSIFDILNFLNTHGEHSEIPQTILKNCTIYFIPMLNPDGAERFSRRNAQGIDMNRDALSLQAPESKLLMNQRDAINPDFGFNLHDQDIWYASGNTEKPASISFLAPAFDSEKSIDDKRLRSMQLIVLLNKMLQNFIPGQTAKYYDDFMPTAFGDTIQMKGTSTILIESGGQYNDPEKQFIRKLNTILLLEAFKLIAENTYKAGTIAEYEGIPFNTKNKLFDYILRNCIIRGDQGKFKADIGIRSIPEAKYERFEISDIGDLRYFHAYFDKDLKGKSIELHKIGDDATSLIQSYL
jgi:hypothetical protein